MNSSVTEAVSRLFTSKFEEQYKYVITLIKRKFTRV
jgi:hypothetical protein